ncbi:hypothetical protein [Butyrivibrio sp. AC2005]|uniref:hypothetical protein n=1 Tax=Butyrivibrio sp. AC2005 TaxID=1280672 RepID=UPI00042A2F24|nr:hypothetical protein [Butyrivibrio sp. AC2005]
MTHHRLDPYPIPKDEMPLYVNEPWLIDKSLLEYPMRFEPEEEDDNVRVYVPLDLNKEATLRRLDHVIAHYGETNENDEMDFSVDVGMILSQVEVYDQVWYVRNMPEDGKHSKEAVALVREIVESLKAIPDGCAERFPFEDITELEREYLQ